MNRSASVEAPAKVNLRLAVLAREVSGFHSLETILCGISLADRLDVEIAEPGVHLEVIGEVPTADPEENLVVRAVRSFYRELHSEPNLRVKLEKRIPAGAGLGGGSSDAAATLRALDHLHDHPLPPETLLGIAAELGSDVPFFLSGSPLALAWGRGERLLSLEPLPRRRVLIVHPGVALPTPAAFKRYAELRDESTRPVPHVLPREAIDSWDQLRSHALNDLELVAFEKITRLPHILRLLLESGASIALLAGSGSCVFGIFPLDADLDLIARNLERNGLSTWSAETLDAWPEPRSGD